MLKHFITSLIGIVIVFAILYATNTLHISIASFILGFFFLGFISPDLVDEWLEYGHTVWVPILFTVFGILGLYARFGNATLQLLTNLAWCPRTPCSPYSFLFIAFFIGNACHWAAHFWLGEELDLLGEKKEEHKKKKK